MPYEEIKNVILEVNEKVLNEAMVSVSILPSFTFVLLFFLSPKGLQLQLKRLNSVSGPAVAYRKINTFPLFRLRLCSHLRWRLYGSLYHRFHHMMGGIVQNLTVHIISQWRPLGSGSSTLSFSVFCSFDGTEKQN